jgi:long-chain fatty acid transport protein
MLEATEMKRILFLIILGLGFLIPARARAQGIILPGSGAMHMSMGGASTAVGTDAVGALYWNPAAISGLQGSEVVIGGQVLFPDIHLGSTIFGGPLGPPTQSGETISHSGVSMLPGIGWVYKPDDSPLSYGMGLFSLVGGGVNFPGDNSNPLLSATGPFKKFILGPQESFMLSFAVSPTISYQVTDRLAVGAGPMMDMAIVSFDPAFFAPPAPNGLGQLVFPAGTHSHPFWGGGFRAGLTYKIFDNLTFGFSYTSPQWFEQWRFEAKDPNGNPTEFQTHATFPMIFSWGLAYAASERLLLAADLRYIDYKDALLFGTPVRDGGAGWNSVFAVAAGSRYLLTDRLSVQLGYLFNQNPVPSNLALFNTELPAITMHTITAGFYYQVTDAIGMSLAYEHGFRNSISGRPVLQLPGASVSLDSEFESFLFGLHFRFGSWASEHDDG